MPFTAAFPTPTAQPNPRIKMQSAARPWQQNNFGQATASPRVPHPLTAPYGTNAGLCDNAQAAIPTSPGISFDLSVGEHSRLPTCAPQMTTAAADPLDRTLAQQRRQQTQWQQPAWRALQARQYKQQWISLGRQAPCQQVRGKVLAQHLRQLPKSYMTPTRPQHILQQQLRQNGSSLAYANPSRASTPQGTLQQLPESASLFAAYPQLQKSIVSNSRDNSQQYNPQTVRPATFQPSTAFTFPTSPQLKPARCFTTMQVANPELVVPQLKIKEAVSAPAETTLRNEMTERFRLGKDLRQERKQHARRREMLVKDPTAIYHNYNEVLECFPLRRGERPNPYLKGLLANQPLPAEPNDDRELAIQYAKKYWEEYWELKDLNYVLARAKKDEEKKSEQRKRTNRLASVASRR